MASSVNLTLGTAQPTGQIISVDQVALPIRAEFVDEDGFERVVEDVILFPDLLAAELPDELVELMITLWRKQRGLA